MNSVAPISQPFFVPDGQVISVDGHEVQVFEFCIEEDAQLAAGTISPDGSAIGTSMISWVKAPHFYNSGKLIVLYVGEEDAVLDVLEVVLGPKFAGREIGPAKADILLTKNYVAQKHNKRMSRHGTVKLTARATTKWECRPSLGVKNER